MPPSVDKQRKNQLSEKIKEYLILLRGEYGFSNREIASRLGVGENYLSNVFNGGKAGSTQLLAALELLKELTVLKATGVRTNPDLLREIEVMKLRLAEMERMVSPNYGEHVPQSMMLNEEAETPSSSEVEEGVKKLWAAGGAKAKKRDPEK